MTILHPQIIRLDETTSTNDYLEKYQTKAPLPEGSMVIARHQTHGKGQENNHWESEADKNLTFSLVLYPHFVKAEQQFVLTQVLSLSLCALLDGLNLPAKAMIKWPNDIYVGQHKVAGMLIKNNITGNYISQTIAGIGLNVNQLSFTKNAPNAISLATIAGREYDPDVLLTMWHSLFMKEYEVLRKGSFTEIRRAYLSRFYRLNEMADYIIEDKKQRATIKGIGEYGMLKLTAEDGSEFTCGMKEVVFLP